MKKFFINTAIVALAAVMFTACQQSGQSETGNTPADTEVSTTDSIVSPDGNVTAEETQPEVKAAEDKQTEPEAKTEDAVETPKEKLTADMVGTTYKVTLSPDMLRVCDVYANYRNADGKEVAEKITSTSWLKRIPARKMPLQRGISCTYKVKSNLPAGEKDYNFKCEMETYDDVTGRSFSYTGVPVNTKSTVKMTPEQIKQFFAEKSNRSDDPGKTSSYGFIIDMRNGNPENVSINWAPQLAPSLVK